MNKILLKAKDRFQIEDFLSKLQKLYPNYELRRFYDIGDFISSVTEYSLFDEEKVIAVFMDFTSEDVKAFSSVLESLTDDPVVLIQGKAISKTKGYTNITVDFDIKTLEPIKQKECPAWFSSLLKERGVKFGKGVPELVVSLVGTDQFSLQNEADKMALVKDSVSFDTKNVGTYISGGSNSDFFTFFENLTHKRVRETLDGFENISAAEYTGLCIFLVSQLEKLYKINNYRLKKLSVEDIAGLVGIPEFILKTKIFTVYAFFPKVKMLKAIDTFIDLSESLRTTKFDKKILFEMALLKVLSK